MYVCVASDIPGEYDVNSKILVANAKSPAEVQQNPTKAPEPCAITVMSTDSQSTSSSFDIFSK